jgi:hypothetical protein
MANIKGYVQFFGTTMHTIFYLRGCKLSRDPKIHLNKGDKNEVQEVR